MNTKQLNTELAKHKKLDKWWEGLDLAEKTAIQQADTTHGPFVRNPIAANEKDKPPAKAPDGFPMESGKPFGGVGEKK